MIARYVSPKNGHLGVDKQTDQRAPPSTSRKVCCPLTNPAVNWERSRSFSLYCYRDVSCVTPACAWLVAFNTGTVYIAFVPRGSQFGANTMPTQSLLSAHGQRMLAGLFLCPPPLRRPPHLLWIVASRRKTVEAAGLTTRTVGSALPRAICDREALHGYRLKWCRKDICYGDTVVGPHHCHLQLAFYSCCCERHSAETIFRNESRRN